jgi:hypothetical protein
MSKRKLSQTDVQTGDHPDVKQVKQVCIESVHTSTGELGEAVQPIGSVDDQLAAPHQPHQPVPVDDQPGAPAAPAMPVDDQLAAPHQPHQPHQPVPATDQLAAPHQPHQPHQPVPVDDQPGAPAAPAMKADDQLAAPHQPHQPHQPVPANDQLAAPHKPNQPHHPVPANDQLAAPAAPVQVKHVFGQLVLTAQQVKLCKLLADQDQMETLASAPIHVRVCSVAGWPDYVVEPSTTALLQQWFDNTSTDRLCQMHGLVGLDKLLAASNWLGVQACVDQIVNTSIVQAKLHRRCVDQTTGKLYTQLASRTGFPPVSPDWPGVAELCWLCDIMPTILARNLQNIWVDKLLVGPTGPIRQLYLFDNRLSSTPSLAGVGLTLRPGVCIAANSFFVVRKDNNMCKLIKLSLACRIAHNDDDDDDDDDDEDDDEDDDDDDDDDEDDDEDDDDQHYPNDDGEDGEDGEVVHSQPGVGALLRESPDAAYIAMISRDDHAVICVSVIDARTGTKLTLAPHLAAASDVSWLSSSELAFATLGRTMSYLTVKLDQLDQPLDVSQMSVGTSGARSSSTLCRCLATLPTNILLFGDDWSSEPVVCAMTPGGTRMSVVDVDCRDQTGNTFVCKDSFGYFTVSTGSSGTGRMSYAQAFEACSRLVWSSNLARPTSPAS